MMTKKEMRDKNLISFCNLHLFATDNGGYKSKANRCKTHWSKWFGFDSKRENELQKVFSALSTFLYHRSTMLPCVSDYSTFSFNDMHIAHAHNVITCPFFAPHFPSIILLFATFFLHCLVQGICVVGLG